MESFKGYAIRARLGGQDILAADVVRRVQWRVAKSVTPGTKGDSTAHNGRASYVDSVTALLTLADAKALMKLGDSTDLLMWRHPLLDPMFGRLENLSLPVNPGLDGYFMATFEVVEHREPDQQDFLIPSQPAGAKARADAAFANFGADMDGLADIPTQDGASLGTAFDTFSDSYGAMGSAFDAVADGTGTWQDLSRSLSTVTDAADSMIGAVRAVEDEIESTADSLIRDVLTVVETARDAVDVLQGAAGGVVSFVTTAPSDLYSMMRDAGLEITDAAVATIMESTGIIDPLAILPGTEITLPRRKAA